MEMKFEWIPIREGVSVYLTRLEDTRETKRAHERRVETMLLQAIFGYPVQLVRDEKGKPSIAQRCISISHSKHWLCIAISGQEIGVDVEEVQERIAKVKYMFLPKEEAERVTSLHELTVCWSTKEAIYKIAGEEAGGYGQHIQLGEVCSCADKQYRCEVIDREDFVIVVAERV